MPRQYDVYDTRDGPTVVILQSDLLAETNTRVVIPLRPQGDWRRPAGHIHPQVQIGGTSARLDPLFITTLTLDDLTTHRGTLRNERDLITRAVDALTSGI